MVAEAIQHDFSEELAEEKRLRFVVIHKVALYSDDGLRELAERHSQFRPLRRGKPDRRRNPIRETV